MNCTNDYCIYNRGYECILDGININSLGMCDDCIMVEVDKGFLESEKEKQLKRIRER